MRWARANTLKMDNWDPPEQYIYIFLAPANVCLSTPYFYMIILTDPVKLDGQSNKLNLLIRKSKYNQVTS